MEPEVTTEMLKKLLFNSRKSGDDEKVYSLLLCERHGEMANITKPYFLIQNAY